MSDNGFSQLTHATDTLKSIQRCISSPLIRCHAWTSAYCQQQSLFLEVDDQLQEMDFGDWDGQYYQSLWESTEKSTSCSIGDFWQDPWQHQPPNGESMASFVNRVDSWWQDFCEHLLARVLNLPIPGTAHLASIEVPYGCLIKISLYRDESGKVWSKLLL